jgi:hypothetical protein
LRGRRRATAVACALLAAAAAPAACGEGRERARLAALEAGIASAQASLSALSAAGPPPPGGAPPAFRPVGVASASATAAVTAAPFTAGPRPLSASGLLGAGPDALGRWFGDPDLRRPEGNAEVRLYLGPDCALDIVLYAEGGALRVSHAAARAEGAAAVTEAECLRGIGGGGAGRAAAAGHTGRR